MISAGAVTYDYDLRGNLEQIADGSNLTTYAYDAADRLTNVTLPDTTVIAYGYDADGRRIKQTVGPQITNYLWDEASPYGDVVYEYDGSGATLASYVLGGTGLVSQTRSGATNYFLQDGQGSTRALTNSSGAVTDTYSYTAFGEIFNHAGSTVNPYQYTGQQFDSLTGLYNLRARYYNSALGRFLSQDTYPYNFGNPVELNRYVYVANNPVNLADPTGQLAAEYTPLTVGNAVRTVVIVGIAVVAMYAVYQLVETLPSYADVFERIAQEHYQNQRQPTPEATPFPPPWPVTASVSTPQPTPQPTETPRPGEKILIVGDGNFSYTVALAGLHPNWDITGSAKGNGSNKQIVIPGPGGNVTLVTNVDATRLESGAVTGNNKYDAIIFNNPFVRKNDDYSNATLIQNFIQSARTRLNSNGVIHINVTQEFLIDYPMSAEALGLFNNSRSVVKNLPTFGATEYFAPYMPQYNTGDDYPFNSPWDTQKLKNFQFR